MAQLTKHQQEEQLIHNQPIDSKCKRFGCWINQNLCLIFAAIAILLLLGLGIFFIVEFIISSLPQFHGWYPIDLVTYHKGRIMYVDTAKQHGFDFDLLFLNDTPRSDSPLQMSLPQMGAIGLRFGTDKNVYYVSGEGWLSTSKSNWVYNDANWQPFLFQFVPTVASDTGLGAFTMNVFDGGSNDHMGVCYYLDSNVTNYLCDTRSNTYSQLLIFYIIPRI